MRLQAYETKAVRRRPRPCPYWGACGKDASAALSPRFAPLRSLPGRRGFCAAPGAGVGTGVLAVVDRGEDARDRAVVGVLVQPAVPVLGVAVAVIWGRGADVLGMSRQS
jgi:hypothetical protein